MKILLILAPLVVALIAAIGTMGVVGMLMPKSHRATRSVRLGVAPEQVWSVVTDFENAASWRGLKKVERLADRNGHPVWNEVGRQGAMPIEIEVFEPPRKMVGRIADPHLPFGGTWTYEFSPESNGCRLRITEDGEIYNPVFRYIARIIGYSATIEGYLKTLGKRLGQPVAVEP